MAYLLRKKNRHYIPESFLVQRNKELDFLFRATQELMCIQKMDQFSVLSDLLYELTRHVHSLKAFVWLVDPRTLEPTCRFGVDSNRNPLVRASEAFDSALVHSAVKSGKSEATTAKSADNLGNYSILVVLMESAGVVIGAIELLAEEQGRLTATRRRLAEAFAKSLALALTNVKASEELVTLAQMQVQQRLAGDLHDAINQSLFSASLIAEVLPRLWEKNTDDALRSLQDLRVLIRGASAELRGILGELRPALMTNTELPILLRQLGDAFTSRTNVPMVIKATGQGGVPIPVHEELHKFCHEALTNIAKHAHASQVKIELQYDPKNVYLKIQDDGVGFQLSDAVPGKYGLTIMRERAHAVGAHIEIVSAPGLGTELVWSWTAKSN